MSEHNLALEMKLGLKSHGKAFTLHAPTGYEHVLPSAVSTVSVEDLNQGTEWVQAFYLSKAMLEDEISRLKRCLAKDGQLWISWPKKTSKVTTDLTDNVVRQVGINNGLVDVKVASINDIWSGLKFVYRLTDR